MTYRGKSLLGSSLINTAAGMLSLAAGFAASVIVARVLGVEGTGIVAIALWIMALGVLVSDFGMPQVALRFIAGNVGADESRSTLLTALTKRFVVTTGIMAIGIFGYSLWLDRSGDVDSALVWAATAVLFLSYAYSTMSLAAAHGLGQFGDAAGKTLVGCIIQPVAILAGALLIGPAGAILGHAARHLPQALALRKYVSRDAAPSSLITPAMKRYARDNWVAGGLEAILQSRVELAIIGLSFSILEVGYYAIGMTMAGMVLQLTMFLVASLVPYFGYLHDRNDIDGLIVGYQRSLRWVGIVLAPICFGGAAIAPVLIPAVFGEQFAPAVPVSEVLLAFSFAYALVLVPSRMMLAKERSTELLWLSIAGGGVSVALMIAVVPYFGGLGAAWVRGLVAVASFILMLWYCQKRLGMACVPADFIKIVAAGLLTALAARLAMVWVPGLGGMLLGVAAGAVVYLASVIALSLLTADERAWLRAWVSGHLRDRQWIGRPRVHRASVTPLSDTKDIVQLYDGWLKRKSLHLFWRAISVLPDRAFVRLKYFSMSWRFPDLRNPKSFSEKVQIRKLYDRNPLYPVMVDKCAAKTLIRERAGDQYVIETLWTGRDLKEVDWTKIQLPAVIKPTHGSGNGIFLRSRSDIDRLLADDPVPEWLAQQHSLVNREWAYGKVVPQVIIERMLIENGDVPNDYRFFVFSGKVSHIEVRLRRDGIDYESYHAPDWQRMAYCSGYHIPYPHELPRPAELDEMLDVALKMARDIDFMRVDLYAVEGRVYVGELTLYPGGGFPGCVADEHDEALGGLWTLKVQDAP